jgi:hypothetical protein
MGVSLLRSRRWGEIRRPCNGPRSEGARGLNQDAGRFAELDTRRAPAALTGRARPCCLAWQAKSPACACACACACVSVSIWSRSLFITLAFPTPFSPRAFLGQQRLTCSGVKITDWRLRPPLSHRVCHHSPLPLRGMSAPPSSTSKSRTPASLLTIRHSVKCDPRLSTDYSESHGGHGVARKVMSPKPKTMTDDRLMAAAPSRPAAARLALNLCSWGGASAGGS